MKKMALEVFKTEKEKALSFFYQAEMKRHTIVPQEIIEQYKIDVRKIKLENPLYNQKLN